MGNFYPKITHKITPFEIFHLLYYASRMTDFSQKKFGCHANVTLDLKRKYKMKNMTEGYRASVHV